MEGLNRATLIHAKDLRAWYDDMQMAKKSTIQASASVSALHDSLYSYGGCSFDDEDEFVLNMIGSRDDVDVRGDEKVSWDAETVSRLVLADLNQSEILGGSMTLSPSYNDGFVLADDLTLLKDPLHVVAAVAASSAHFPRLESKKYTSITKAEDVTANRGITSITSSSSSSVKIKENLPQKQQQPFLSAKDQFVRDGGKLKDKGSTDNGCNNKPTTTTTSISKDVPPELAHIEKALLERIEADIIDEGAKITFDDIAGLEFAKKCVTEAIVWPITRPDLFKGLRALPRGLLLFGPPGTGKTLIGKAISHEVGATFFSISASSLTSKWIGEGERTVRALFALANYRAPSVVFIDEVDSLLCQRSSDENEASRRIKTEFLVQLDGAGTAQDSRVVILGATNRPEELDEAARRRFVKRIYIPLPDYRARRQLFVRLLSDVAHAIDFENDHGSHMGEPYIVEEDNAAMIDAPRPPLDPAMGLHGLALATMGFSGADIRSLCTEAAMGPLREAALNGGLSSLRESEVLPIEIRHFEEAFDAVVPSNAQADLKRYVDWNTQFGSFRKMA